MKYLTPHSLLLFVLLSLSFSSLAQSFRPLVQLDIQPTESTEVYAFSGPEGMTLLFKEGRQAQLFILNHQFEVQNQFPVYGLPEGNSLRQLGFTNQEKELHIYYWSEDLDEYEVYSISKDNGTSSNGKFDLGRTRKGHVYWGTFTYEGILHILRMPRSGNTIRLCRFEGGNNFSTEDFNINKPDFFEKTNFELSRIENPEEVLLTENYLPGKMYHYGDMVYLTLEEAESTYLVSIDLLNLNKTERSYSVPLSLPEDRSVLRSNSMVLGQELFQVAASQDSVALLIRNISTGRVMNSFRYGKDETIGIQTGNIIATNQEGDQVVVYSTRDLLSDITASSYIAINAREVPDNSEIELCIGSVQPSSIKGISGIVLDESYETTFFRSILRKPSFQPISAPIASVDRKRIFPNSEPHSIKWRHQGKTFKGYYDRRKGKFILGR